MLPPRDRRSSSAHQEVPVKVKLQPAPELSLTHQESRGRPREKRYKSLRVAAAWENEWPTLPQLNFTTVSRHEIDTRIREKLMVGGRVSRSPDSEQVFPLVFFFLNLKEDEVNQEVRWVSVQDINSTRCGFVQEAEPTGPTKRFAPKLHQ